MSFVTYIRDYIVTRDLQLEACIHVRHQNLSHKNIYIRLLSHSCVTICDTKPVNRDICTRETYVYVCCQIYVWLHTSFYACQISFHTYMSLFNGFRETSGRGSIPKNFKRIPTTANKSKESKIMMPDAGGCDSITGTRFPYNISLSTNWCEQGNALLLKTSETKKWVRTQTKKKGYRQLGYLPLASQYLNRSLVQYVDLF